MGCAQFASRTGNWPAPILLQLLLRLMYFLGIYHGFLGIYHVFYVYLQGGSLLGIQKRLPEVRYTDCRATKYIRHFTTALQHTLTQYLHVGLMIMTSPCPHIQPSISKIPDPSCALVIPSCTHQTLYLKTRRGELRTSLDVSVCPPRDLSLDPSQRARSQPPPRDSLGELFPTVT